MPSNPTLSNLSIALNTIDCLFSSLIFSFSNNPFVNLRLEILIINSFFVKPQLLKISEIKQHNSASANKLLVPI